jgi:hypothetical protein
MLTIKQIQAISKQCGYVENKPLSLMTLINIILKALEVNEKQK